MKRLSCATLALLSSLSLTGCATGGHGYGGYGDYPHRSTVGGALIGGAGGALLGGAVSGTGQGALIGGAVGAAVGGLVGNSMDRKRNQRRDYGDHYQRNYDYR
jgi:outer membrane lipoprotein SlyB